MKPININLPVPCPVCFCWYGAEQIGNQIKCKYCDFLFLEKEIKEINMITIKGYRGQTIIEQQFSELNTALEFADEIFDEGFTVDYLLDSPEEWGGLNEAEMKRIDDIFNERK